MGSAFPAHASGIGDRARKLRKNDGRAGFHRPSRAPKISYFDRADGVRWECRGLGLRAIDAWDSASEVPFEHLDRYVSKSSQYLG